VIIPCRNEEEYIGRVLDNVLSQDYPTRLLEVFVVDGRSDDGTAAIIREYAATHSHIAYLENPEQVVPFALNRAIKRSTGSIIIRMDAHSEYPDDYITSLVSGLDVYKCDNAGGAWVTMPGDDTLKALAIADATSHPFGIGNAYYRLDIKEPRQVDTVPYGCYRRDVFDRIGLFDEELARNQDDEFNARLIRNGGSIFLLPQVKIRYYARKSYRKMSRMFYEYGLYKPLVNIKVGAPATLRQFVPPLFLMSLLVSALLGILNPLFWHLCLLIMGTYLIANLLVSILIILGKSRPASEVLHLLISFPLIHFSYGSGYLIGSIRFGILRKRIRPESVKPNR
jgi:glycosyltransferase involved in cell wall biosynthesis